MTQFPLLALASVFLLHGCVEATLAWAPTTPNGIEPRPAILEPWREQPSIETIAAWEQQRAPAYRQALSEEVYGFMPATSSTKLIAHRLFEAQAYDGRATVEEFQIVATAEFDGVPGRTSALTFNLISPNTPKLREPYAVVLIESFCSIEAALPAGARRSGFVTSITTFVFGRYICAPPIEDILDAGFAVVITTPASIIPDSGENGIAVLSELARGHEDIETRWGAISAWAWLFSRIVDVLEVDPRFTERPMIAYGHSRYGKSALVAAAFDPRIAGVIAHQSGTGGASLNRAKPGESVKAITRQYPHWFAKRYAGFAGREHEMSVDQHMLLGLIAPRPVFLGNARRDVWSDPNGAFRAAQGAHEVYALYGAQGLAQARLDEFNPQAGIVFWMRPGTHGVVKEDWPAFLAFLDAHFGRGAVVASE